MNAAMLTSVEDITHTIITRIQSAQKNHTTGIGLYVDMEDMDGGVQLPGRPVSIAELRRLRRQFLSMTTNTAMGTQHAFQNKRAVQRAFVDYLNNAWQ